ncbi:NAD(P)-dependent oxidoreductase [Lactobacillus delbrueckii]|uniref:NAD(P)-dependent oxidoreductase n=1 Tax=Lactobacillus delbrueckii TaxID=1584 RepID=UPI001E5DAFB1|nr:NAD(P)-dependent oxidoreductase [Lactobacillus delbrueckii]MCD5446549.1 dihydrofolate reductase [Lactobacillus delbrueckii subsp. lactis]
MENAKVLVAGLAVKQLPELEKVCEVTFAPAGAGKDWYLANLGDFDALISGKLPVDQELLDAGKKLKIVSATGVGYDHIDVDYASSQGIIVSNCPASVMQPTAEMAFTLLLALSRKLALYNQEMRQGNFLDTGLLENQGQSPVGKTLASYARTFGMNILYHNRHQLPENEERALGVSYVPFADLLSQADYVSLNAPATAETYHVIDEAALSMMQPTAFLINTSRGSLVDEAALLRALKGKRIAGAGLDVFEEEPDFNKEFCQLDNVILTPHAGSATRESRRSVLKEASHNIVSFLVDGVPVNRVN